MLIHVWLMLYFIFLLLPINMPSNTLLPSLHIEARLKPDEDHPLVQMSAVSTFDGKQSSTDQ